VKTITVPASVETLTLESFARAAKVEDIHFEPGCRIRSLKSHTFGECVRLTSICIPASVKVICTFFLAPVDGSCLCSIREVTFERGSKLREIQERAFAGCIYLASICLPASLKLIDGQTFAYTDFKDITFEEGNPYFTVKKSLIVDSSGTCLVRHFGDGTELIIPDEIETLGCSCFFDARKVCAITFSPMSRVSSIEDMAFMNCSKLQSIIIPAAIKSLPTSCFCFCDSIEVVSFGVGSQLLTIDAEAFANSALRSITVPANLEVIGKNCFKGCSRLEEVNLPRDSKLVRIEAGAFECCTALTRLFVPQLVEFVGEYCFMGCTGICTLMFAPACHLRQLLDLPPAWSGFHEIPDSVEDLALAQSSRPGRACPLMFGDESRLVSVRARWRFVAPRPSFLRVSTRSLKIFRSSLEFGF
jgi:hypothetical protein